ncbi:DoxX family protein [Belliella kenyensis]|nr:DoxX family protein [Belliella kenyensis]MCH7400471.1 DoxX family protein [Belliella kenyensis]MDN3604513.1 DoxX family protein [Belliella kenyensis]
MYSLFLYLMSGLYVFAGFMHFIKPKMYERIIPPYIPNPKLMNILAGGFEIILGIGLLFEETKSLAAFGIIALLIAVFPANIYMYQKGAKGIPKWALLLRLPMQFLLIAWAYVYT